MSELTPETEELLERGRAGAPMSRAHRDELKGAVLAKLAAGAVVTTSTGAAAWPAAWTATTKVIGVAAFAAVVGAGSVGVVKYRAHARASQTVPTSTIAMNTAPQISPAASQSAIPNASTNAPIDVTAGNETPQTLPQIQVPTPIQDPATTIAAPIAAATNTPVTTTAPTTTSANSLNSAPIVNPANNGGSGNSAANNFPTSPTTNSPSTTAPQKSSLEEETTLLRAAHDALAAGDPAGALRLLDEHAARFPNSALEPERSAERVFAYCAESNTRYAHAAAGSFLAAHPTGPLATRVRSSCGARYEK